MPPKRIAPLADNLIATLHIEAEALDEMKALFEQQLESLRAGDAERLEELTPKVQECSAVLENKREKCERRVRLLGRMLETSNDASIQELIDALEAQSEAPLGQRLAQARATVEERAAEVNRRSETLGFALQYAADLNHELLAAMKGAADEENVHTYTAAGQAEPASDDRSLVNTIG